MADTTVYIPEEMAAELDTIAAQNIPASSRSAVARYLIQEAIDVLKAALANPQPYPSLPEAPADCDEQTSEVVE